MSWVMMMARRPARTFFSSLRSSGAAWMSRAAMGSSSSSTSGLAASARATATRWAWPPESSAGRRASSPPASTAASHCRADSRAVCPGDTGAAWPERHVFQGAEVREQQRLLREEYGAAVVRGGPGGGTAVEVEQHLSVDFGTAGIGPQQSGNDVEQGGLPGPVGAEHRHGFPRREVQPDVESPGTHGRLHVEAHRTSPNPLSRMRADIPLARGDGGPGRRYVSPTTVTATATSTRDSATAASASVSRCR